MIYSSRIAKSRVPSTAVHLQSADSVQRKFKMSSQK